MSCMGHSFRQAPQNPGTVHWRRSEGVSHVSQTASGPNSHLIILFRKYSTSPLTSHLGAVVAIKDFRPVFTRIPLPNNCRTMSAESYLAFEVDSINILGSDGESIFGSPKTVEENVKVKAWADDQRKMGGNG